MSQLNLPQSFDIKDLLPHAQKPIAFPLQSICPETPVNVYVVLLQEWDHYLFNHLTVNLRMLKLCHQHAVLLHYGTFTVSFQLKLFCMLDRRGKCFIVPSWYISRSKDVTKMILSNEHFSKGF